MEASVQQHLESIQARYQALLKMSEVIASHRQLSSLLRDLSDSLHPLVSFDAVVLTLFDPDKRTVQLYLLESDTCPPSVPVGQVLPMEESPASIALETRQPFYVADIDLEGRFPGANDMMRSYWVGSYCILPMSTAARQLGALNFVSRRKHAYNAEDIDFMQRVADQVAMAVDNALHHAEAEEYQRQLTRERDRLKVLLDITNILVSNLDHKQLLSNISACLRRLIRHDFASVALYQPDRNELCFLALDFPGGSGLICEEKHEPVSSCPVGLACTTRKPVVLHSGNRQEFDCSVFQVLTAKGFQSACILPLISKDRVLGALNLASMQDHAFSDEDVAVLSPVGSQIAIAVENAKAYSEIAELKDKLAEEKLYLEDEIRSQYNFGEVVGDSEAFRAVLRQAETVAPTGAAVLILGETGTGKELVARAIHELSPQRDRAFIKLNCAAIPTGLLESELFGHEKGAFTGAIAQKIGRFELAHHGTLFLDEVGEIPLELQPKLLRVLQEWEFERLGSTRTIRVEVRIVAATNRDLNQMVQEHQFRPDLYYRLNVFPIQVPPLRERPEDIPSLVRFFAQQCARRMKKRIDTIPTETMDTLARYAWPGNVRELQNLIERAVILSSGPVLKMSFAELKPAAEVQVRSGQTLQEAERQHILQALRESNWVIGGPEGAAVRLGLKRSTLQFRMQKLGISRTK